MAWEGLGLWARRHLSWDVVSMHALLVSWNQKWDSAGKSHPEAVLITQSYGKGWEMQIVGRRYLLKDYKWQGWRVSVGCMELDSVQKSWCRGSWAVDMQRKLEKHFGLYFLSVSSKFWEYKENFVRMSSLAAVVPAQVKTLMLHKLGSPVAYQLKEGLFSGRNET